jgi:hypothetical protein
MGENDPCPSLPQKETLIPLNDPRMIDKDSVKRMFNRVNAIEMENNSLMT